MKVLSNLVQLGKIFVLIGIFKGRNGGGQVNKLKQEEK